MSLDLAIRIGILLVVMVTLIVFWYYSLPKCPKCGSRYTRRWTMYGNREHICLDCEHIFNIKNH